MLNGGTALVVEEEILIALDIQRMLEALDVGQTLFARTPAEAEHLRASFPQISLAVVEVRSLSNDAFALVANLRRAGIRVVLTTADTMPARAAKQFPELALLPKPLHEDALASAVRQALAATSQNE